MLWGGERISSDIFGIYFGHIAQSVCSTFSCHILFMIKVLQMCSGHTSIDPHPFLTMTTKVNINFSLQIDCTVYFLLNSVWINNDRWTSETGFSLFHGNRGDDLWFSKRR